MQMYSFVGCWHKKSSSTLLQLPYFSHRFDTMWIKAFSNRNWFFSAKSLLIKGALSQEFISNITRWNNNIACQFANRCGTDNLTEHISEDCWINGHSKTYAVCDLLVQCPCNVLFFLWICNKAKHCKAIGQNGIKTKRYQMT